MMSINDAVHDEEGPHSTPFDGMLDALADQHTEHENSLPEGVTLEDFTQDEAALITDALTALWVRAPRRHAEITSFLDTHPTFGLDFG